MGETAELEIGKKYYEKGGHLKAYNNPDFWEKYGEVFVIRDKKIYNWITDDGEKTVVHEPPSDLLAAAIAAVKVPVEKIRKYLAELPRLDDPESINERYARDNVIRIFNPELSIKESREVSKDDTYYKELIDSLSEDEVRRTLLTLEALNQLYHEAVKRDADIRDVYKLAFEYYRNTKDQGFRNLVLHSYNARFCKMFNHRDRIQKAHEVTESAWFEIPEIAAYLSAVYGKKIAEIATVIAGSYYGTQFLKDTALGDISHEIFKEVLKESPSLASNPSFMDMFLNSHTALPLIVATSLSMAGAYLVGKAVERASLEAGGRLDTFGRVSRKTERVRDLVEECFDRAYEILTTVKGPNRFTEMKFVRELRLEYS